MNESPFLNLLHRSEQVGLQTDDVLAAILPLFRQVAEWHKSDLVAPLEALASIECTTEGALYSTGTPIHPARNLAAVEALQRPQVSALHVVGRTQMTSNEEGSIDHANLEVSEGEKPLVQPAYILGYRTWENLLGHHDTSTDILALGQILASLSLGLDFTDIDELANFASNRANLFAINSRLHPVLAAVIAEMTELNRHRRSPDLTALVHQLENYREQKADLDIAQLPGFSGAKLPERRRLIQTHLRDRLFEISRRNRLIHFRQSQASLNLTVASVPLVLNLNSIKLEQLFVWHPQLASEIIDGKAINLGRWLRFEDQPYLPSALDKLISDARRDRAEYGFAQLRLVLAFLHWHNLKESPQERIVSPLLLLPVELSKKKGVRDKYILEPTSSEAEVNPALRHHLCQTYGLHLPERIDLDTTALEQFHQEIQNSIRATEPAVNLRLIDRPEIRLIHERARQRLTQYQRKQKLRPTTKRSKASFSYSYDNDNFRPLGLQLFREKVVPSPLPQRSAAGGLHTARMPQMVTSAPSFEPVIETERQTFALSEDRPANPYSWDFDLCSMTLGNFNYRKMSLVRDYSTMLDDSPSSKAFDSVFSLDPRKIDDDQPPELSLREQWPVVRGDATQTAAVTLARTGRSYIIQGPPGTGKSQTITNLIADQVARNRRVLFVCEKRAAIDVVFHRLRQQGLDELCTLIHDSQTDKKAFVLNLKQTYEKWLTESNETEQLRLQRDAVLGQIEQDLDSLRRFDEAMRSVPDDIAIPVRELLHRLVELSGAEPALLPEDAERLPTFATWRQHAALAKRLSITLTEISGRASLASHAFRWLGNDVIRAERPLETLHQLSEKAEALLEEVENILLGSSLAKEHWNDFKKIEQLIDFASRIAEIAERDQLDLLDSKSQASKALLKTVQELRKHSASVERAQTKTKHWREPLLAPDLASAIELAKANERSHLRLFKPAWWRLKTVLKSRYDFSQHAIPPSYLQILSDLDAEYAAGRAYDETYQTALSQYSVDPTTLLTTLVSWQSNEGGDVSTELRKALLNSAEARALVIRITPLAPSLHQLSAILTQLINSFREWSLEALGEAIRDLREEADTLPDMLPLLAELAETHDDFAQALRSFPFTPDQFEAAIARAALEKIYHTARWLPRFDGRLLAYRAERIEDSERDWLDKNAALLRAEVRHRFRTNIQTSTLSASQLDPAGKTFKKSYSAGRRELEHEFGKTMRYKSIRDLAAGDTGKVIRDLKPIWLMSPLSVSDTLPLITDLFDVVIFDEASQIPVEEAVPALYRAPQVIVVGDEMQLPPTNFFSASSDAESELLEAEEDGERVAVSLDADSFLTQSAKNLPATLLAWHYRSRSESLIGFSNAAFYSGNLFTIPDRTLPGVDQTSLPVRADEDPAVQCSSLLERPLSFHFMEKSPYENRSNTGEATYIASLVRELLNRNTTLSIGIVAFSEAQQGEIESALERLASEDSDFAALLEEEYVREENDQFCGLFVKNLENVQGDERDIILLSICYGPDTQGRMVMNFGPINQRGGEKRLNVIFSRARQHMAVISSIRHSVITNDHNDGAAALKGFLHYAECASRGDQKMSRSILEGLNPVARKQLAVSSDRDAVISQLAIALEQRGFRVDRHVGQSRFRCDLAVRSAETSHYSIGILIDTSQSYVNPNVTERFVTLPGILRSFGWRISLVLTRDWYHDPVAVLDRLERLISGEAEPAFVPDEIISVIETPNRATVPSTLIGNDQAPTIAANPPSSLYLEFIEGRSSKFWSASQDGGTIVVRYGRLGTQGQTLSKTFDTEERAVREIQKLKAEKLRKGYTEKWN